MKNLRVFLLSLVAIIFVFLGIFVDWIFLAISVIIMIINQRELFGKQKTKKGI